MFCSKYTDTGKGCTYGCIIYVSKDNQSGSCYRGYRWKEKEGEEGCIAEGGGAPPSI
ncbi:MAG: hypothetical protein WKF36_08890 [Candidatus Nitrosocosmicus sp.]